MLREITTLRYRGDNRRRWFSDADMDLFVWYRNQVPVQFQLAFDKQHQERAISWDTDRGLSHSRIDDGEGRPARYKMTPILVDDGDFDCMRLARQFLARGEYLDPMLADFIVARLLEFPCAGTPYRDRHADRGTA